MSAKISLHSHSHQTLLQTVLLLFSILFLPRSTYPYIVGGPDAPPQTKSADKPQSAWLNPITYEPTLTLFWWTLGPAVICFFRAVWIRRNLTRSQEKEKIESSKVRIERKDRRKEMNAAVLRLLLSLVACVALTPLTTVLLVLLGAPVTSDFTKLVSSPSPLTPLLALQLNVLVFLIPCNVIGLPLASMGEVIDTIPALSGSGFLSRLQDSTEKMKSESILYEWLRIFFLFRATSVTDKILLYPALGSLAGAWCGVIPIALDWERPWQTYPLTPGAGAILGFILGSLTALGNHTLVWMKEVAKSHPDTEVNLTSKSAPLQTSTKVGSKPQIEVLDLDDFVDTKIEESSSTKKNTKNRKRKTKPKVSHDTFDS